MVYIDIARLRKTLYQAISQILISRDFASELCLSYIITRFKVDMRPARTENNKG